MFRHMAKNLDRYRKSEMSRLGNTQATDELSEKYEDMCTSQRRINELTPLIKQKEKEAIERAKQDGVHFRETAECRDLFFMDGEAETLRQNVELLESQMDDLTREIPNLVYTGCPHFRGYKNSDNVGPWPYPYTKILEDNGLETRMARQIVGHRGYFIRGDLFMLCQALTQYAMSFLAKRGYELMSTPFFMRDEFMSSCAELENYRDTLYKISDEDSYMIATSEQPMTALYHNKIVTSRQLLGGYSTCFRREAKSKADLGGLFRVHQFDKVEQFCICHPDDSDEVLMDFVKTASDFYQSLGLSFRTIEIPPADLNYAAYRKIDLECYFPHSGEYRELCSFSNTTDYITRRLRVRFGEKGQYVPKEFLIAHQVNGTLCAVQRTLCALVETHQKEGSWSVPEVLKRYMITT